MQFLAVFVAVLAVAAAAPRRAEVWTLNELSEAIDNPSTDPALKPYLIQALNHLMDAIWSGSEVSAVPVITPVGVIEPVSVAGIMPGGNVIADEIIPVAPGAVAEVAAPVAPAPVAEVASGKPLVQLIINVNAQAQEAVAPAGVAEKPVAVVPAGVAEHKPVEEKPIVVAPTPVSVVDGPQAVSPVAVIDTPQVVSPVIVVDKPEVVSPVGVVDVPEVVSPVIVVDQPAVVAPIAVGEPELPAPVAVNPIDVISISPPEFNPVDVISPVPAVEVGSNDGILV